MRATEAERGGWGGVKNSATSVSSSVLFFNQELEILLVPGRRSKAIGCVEMNLFALIPFLCVCVSLFGKLS